MNTKPRRLFVGIRLDPATARVAASIGQRLLSKGLRGRYVTGDDLHVTVAFLGNVDEPRIDDVVAILKRAAAAARPFAMRFDRLGGFPNKRDARVAWLGSSRVNPDFQHLGNSLRSAYAAAGFTFRDDLRLHVTLCRLESHVRLPNLPFDRISMVVEAICLIESMQMRPRYRTVHEAALG